MDEQVKALRADIKIKYGFAVLDGLLCVFWTWLAFRNDSPVWIAVQLTLAAVFLWDAWSCLTKADQCRSAVASLTARQERLRRIGEQ